jgi:hypothetical protein
MHPRTLGIGVLAIAMLLTFGHFSRHSVAAAAQSTPLASRCALADLRGTYGFVRTGETPQGPLAAVGVAQFDGEGNSTVAQSTNRNGTLTQGSFRLTYDVSPDCRGVWYDASGAVTAHFVLVDGGNEIFFLSLSAGNTIAGQSKRIAPGTR